MQASKAPIVIIEPTSTHGDRESQDAVDKSFRILKVANCPSLSEKSTLTYHIACKLDCEDPEPYFRVYKNDGGGQFNRDYVSMAEIDQVIGTGLTFTSGTLRALYPSKSTNSPGFLLAVLRHEKLVSASKANQRAYEQADSDVFLADFAALLESDIALDADAKPLPVKKLKANKSAPAKVIEGAIQASDSPLES